MRLIAAATRNRDVQRGVLLLYGLLLVVAVVSSLARTLPGQQFIGSRERGVRASIEAMARGAPPLTGYAVGADPGAPPTAYPIGVGDDEGVYVVLPALARAVEVSDPTIALLIFTLALMGSLIVVYPLLLFELFDSVAVALIGPLALLTQFSVFLSNDIYWIPAWTVLALLPFVLLAYRHWSRSALLTLGIVIAIASVASSIRGYSGMPILIAAAAVVLSKQRGWARRAIIITALAAVYFSVGPGTVGGARALRDAELGVDWGRSSLGAHPFWHPVYLGLGYLPNPYGIRWDDTVAFEAVQREDPSAGYVTAEYEASLRRQYFAILQSDPGFVLTTYTLKGRQLVLDLMSTYLPLALLLPISLTFGARRRMMRALVLLTLPALAINAIPPLLAIPSPAFERGWLAGGAILWLLGVAWVVAVVPRFTSWLVEVAATVRGWSRDPSAVTRWLAGNVRTLLLLSFLIVAAGAGTRWANDELERMDTTRTYLENSAALGPTQVEGQPIMRWDIRNLPTDWWRNPGATTNAGSGGLALTTTPERFTYQLMSPVLALAPGAYQLSVKARPDTGGITIGVLDADRNSWLVTRNYSAAQGGFDEGTMVAHFRVSESRNVQVVLANWSPNARRSSWILHEAGVFTATE